MTAEIPKAARTHAGTAAVLRNLPTVRKAKVDSTEPYTSIRVTIDGVGIPPAVQREFALAGLSITNFTTNDDGDVSDVVVRNVYHKQPTYVDSAAGAEPAAD